MCDDGRPPSTVSSKDDPNYTPKDNTDGPNDSGDQNPTGDEPSDSNVEAFSDTPTTIPSNPNPNDPTYTVTLETPEDQEDTPMEITGDFTNVREIIVQSDNEQPQTLVSNQIKTMRRSSILIQLRREKKVQTLFIIL